MKKRFLAFLLAVCVAVSMLVLPASAVGSNAAVQTATALGGLTAEQAGSLGAPLTRGQAARLLTAVSAYRDTTTAQGRTGRLYSDVDSDSPYAVYIRTAVQNGWMTGYSDGSFRPDNTVTLEEACTMALRLLGYDVAKLGGTFPTAQLSKASALGLRNEINARQGETLTLEQGTMLFYNALTAMNGSGQVYASTLGFAVSNGQVDISSVLLDNVKGPFVADAATALPFAPAAIYRNDEVTTSAALSPYDVYYYNESARTVWIYNKRAAGRVTAVSPSASAPTSVTVAGVTYAIASPSVAYQLSSLSGGGVGQVVTLLLGMNDAAVSVLTGDAADAVFYGVVQSSSRTLVETNSAEVQQAVSVMCTDGTARTVNVNNKLNFPAGKLVEISVDGDGESVQSISPRSTSGTVSADGMELLDDYRPVYDILFLDVEMKHLDGMETARRVRELDKDVIIVFITNMAQYAIGGYAVGALDYVLKPAPYFAFSQQLRKAEEQLRRRARHYLALPVEGGMRRLDSSLIYYLESEGHRVHFYTEEGDFVAAGTLKAFEEKLAERPFARCNSGYLVNLAQVKSVQQGMVQVGPYELQVSRPRRKAFLAALADHIGGEGA